MANAKNTEPDLDLPAIADIDDDVFLDFSDVEESTGFSALPAGLYPVAITGWKEMVISKLGGKMAVGTKGTQFEFTVLDGHEKAGRKVWNTYWHAKGNLSYLKGLMSVSGKFETLDSKLSYDDIREKLQGAELLVRLTKRPATEQYGESNNVAEVKPYDETMAGIASANADLPG